MRRRPKASPTLFFLLNLFSIPVLSGGIYFVMQWGITGKVLDNHEKAIVKLETETGTTREADSKARSEMANKFLEVQQKQVEALAKLDTRLAVQETKTETTNKTLDKIAEQLSRLTSVAPRQ